MNNQEQIDSFERRIDNLEKAVEALFDYCIRLHKELFGESVKSTPLDSPFKSQDKGT